MGSTAAGEEERMKASKIISILAALVAGIALSVWLCMKLWPGIVAAVRALVCK